MSIGKYFVLGAIVCGMPSVVASGQYLCRPVSLECEHLKSPLGIDNRSPRVSWRIEDERAGARQSAYRIIAGTDSSAVATGKGNMWDTGKVSSADMLVTYSGNSLNPFTRYYWQVTAWDKDGIRSVSDVERFDTGMLDSTNWQGRWISDGHDIDFRPAPYFRKEVELHGPVAEARAYISAAGLFELYINGHKVGDHMLDPLYTRFDRRNLYVTFDVTDLLSSGENAIGVVLGNGWYNHQSMGVWNFHNAPWRGRPSFRMDLLVRYADGTEQVFATDGSWRTSTGPLVANSIYTGEQYDARREMAGWNSTGFDDSGWQKVETVTAPSGYIVAQQAVPIRACEEIKPVKLTCIDDTTWVYDFGRNMSGVTRLTVSGPEGAVVRTKHGERLHPDGRVDLSNINVYHRPVDDTDPFQTDIITLSGKGTDEYMTRFNYKGFRYVEVTVPGGMKLAPENLMAYFVHSDVRPKGKLAASDPIIEKLWRAAGNSYLSNLMGYPTDCPQREKNGWTGDGHFAIESALYNYDGITVYEKWLADHRDEQRPDGVLPDIIPTGGWGYGTDNGTDWTSTIAIIPWNLYLFYGDSKPLADCYENIKRYVNYVDSIAPDGLTTWGRGDWVPVKSHSSKEFTSSVYFYVDATILAKAAAMFGREDDRRHYEALADKIRRAINDKYLDRATGIYAGGSQTELSMPLMWGVVPDDMKAKVAGNLADKVAEANYHLDVGVLGAKAILNALCENGYPETAYRIAVQDTYPSWGWWVVNGATTLLENWDLEATRDISDNHMMFGEIGCWFFKGLGGIYPDENAPGFRHIRLNPYFPADLGSFSATHDSPYGEIVSEWIKTGNEVTYTVTVPPNTTATLTMPANVTGDHRPVLLQPGKHTVKARLKQQPE